MKLYHAGECSKGICETCADVVSTTFRYCDVPFEDQTGMAKDILVAVCDRCGGVVSIPAQSLPALRRARPVAEIPLEVQVPAPDLEVLDAAVTLVARHASPRHRKAILAFFMNRMSRDPESIQKLKNWKAVVGKNASASPAGVRIPQKRLSFKLSPESDLCLRNLVERSGLRRTEVIRGVLSQIRHEVVEPSNPPILQQLREMSEVLQA